MTNFEKKLTPRMLGGWQSSTVFEALFSVEEMEYGMGIMANPKFTEKQKADYMERLEFHRSEIKAMKHTLPADMLTPACLKICRWGKLLAV